MTQRLPKAWLSMALKNIRAFGAGASAEEGITQGIDILTHRRKDGQRVQVRLHGKTVFDQQWDGKQAIKIQLPE